MKLCGEKKLKHGISLYTMAYNVPAEKRGCNMKYTGMPMGMWTLFSKSFEQNLVDGVWT